MLITNSKWILTGINDFDCSLVFMVIYCTEFTKNKIAREFKITNLKIKLNGFSTHLIPNLHHIATLTAIARKQVNQQNNAGGDEFYYTNWVQSAQNVKFSNHTYQYYQITNKSI